MKKLARLTTLLLALAAAPAAATLLTGCDDGPDNGVELEIEGN